MASVRPVTLYVPDSSVEPIEVKVAHSGLRMVLVSREAIPYLDASWAVLGVYFLIGPADEPDQYRAYVGEVGKRTLLKRLKEHVGAKPWWNRALLIASASDDLNSAEIGWLEGSLYDLLKNAVGAEVMNNGRPGDDSLATPEQDALMGYVRSIALALRAVGAPPDTGDQKPAAVPTGRKVYKETVKDLIDAGLLKPGTSLHPLKPGLTQTATLLENGSLEINGQTFAALSPAAVAVSGNKAQAGWDFWGAPSGGGAFVSLFELREKLRDATSTAGTQSGPSVDAGLQAKKPRRSTTSVADLLELGLIAQGETLSAMRKSLQGTTATVVADGGIEFAGIIYQSPSAAAVAASGKQAEAGWDFWAVDRQGERLTLAMLRQQGELLATGQPT